MIVDTYNVFFIDPSRHSFFIIHVEGGLSASCTRSRRASGHGAGTVVHLAMPLSRGASFVGDDFRYVLEKSIVFAKNFDVSIVVNLLLLEATHTLAGADLLDARNVVEVRAGVSDLAKHHQLLLVEEELSDVAFGGKLAVFA